MNFNIGFIGGGNMARAIGETLIQKGVFEPCNVWVSAKTEKTLAYWKNLGTNTTFDNAEIFYNSGVVFLAVKPQYLTKALDITLTTNFSGIIISVIVGVTIEKLEKLIMQTLGSKNFTRNYSLFRTMPNTPLFVGEGITVYSSSIEKNFNHKKTVEKIFSHIGIIEEVDEKLIDSIGALSGSGPAYAYQMIEALADGGVKKGIPRALATKLAAQVFVGAGKMVLETGKHPGQLKDEVCSPGGSTIAGIHAMEAGGVRVSLMNAVEAAANRSKELGS